jgi:ATP-dependent RNA helicase DeaD
MTTEESSPMSFADLNLSPDVLKALDDVGYETPSPIQAKMIPFVLDGRDVLGQAQTGTGKTAAFAMPILSRLDLNQKKPQVLVLAPTRELAIQVAEAFQSYASRIKGFRVLPIYGGQEYGGQIRQLKRGVHVVVGTPGRVMDHMRKGTLDVSGLKTLVLDEADEMLRMGFIDDVEWVLEQIPEERQIALFSATMPQAIHRIAKRFLNNPEVVAIKERTTTASTIRQRYWIVSGMHKLDALTRILEAETFDAIIIFVRTKTATIELAEKLNARGYAVTALNGDIAQNLRERTIEKLKNRKLDILVATDVAARGLDVQRISHVINYDIPHDSEGYVHRIGRTGRAGRSGEAILFVAPREQRMLRTIERSTKQKIELMQLPSVEQINNKRITRFKEKITKTLTNEDLDIYIRLVSQYQTEHDVSAEDIAAALAMMAQGDMSLLLKHHKPEHNKPRQTRKNKSERSNSRSRNAKRPGKKSWESKRSNDTRRSAEQNRSKDNADTKPTTKPAKRKYTYRNPALNKAK